MSQPPPSGSSAGGISSELDSFRQQWRAEVQAKTTPSGATGQQGSGSRDGAPSSSAVASAAPAPPPPQQQQQQQRSQRTIGRRRGSAGAPQTPLKLLSSRKKPVLQDNDDDYVQPRAFDDVVDEGRTLSGGAPLSSQLQSEDGSAASMQQAKQEPESALEHYEKAVEKEAVGSLGDSLRHYRKAFRMDSAVDKKYKNKHFPAPPAAAAGGAAAGKEPVAASSADAAAAARPVREGPPPTLKELIASFAGLAIEAAPPPIEGMPPPPCPLAALPDELLVHILRDVAVDDVGDFVRLARVCRKLAFLVATEDRIWQRVCVGTEFGFTSMHRAWQRAIAWGPLAEEDDGGGHSLIDGDVSEDERRRQQQADSLATTMALRKGATVASSSASSSAAASPAVFPSWQRMFRLRPRIRFNGCYISTVNYIRPGQPSASLVTWNSPVHIVTYFRYLRFFRDGTAISLLTTTEPADVIHHLTKDLVALHQGGAMPHLPSAVMQNALRGRWRMSGIQEGEDGGGAAAADGDPLRATSAEANALPPVREGKPVADAGKSAAAASGIPPSPFSSPAAAIEAESDLVVETEGVGKYYYRMELAFRTAGKGTRNNKLNWRGFYSYDRLTDDWGEFGLKNYRPFFFSRVRSYGVGE